MKLSNELISYLQNDTKWELFCEALYFQNTPLSIQFAKYAYYACHKFHIYYNFNIK